MAPDLPIVYDSEGGVRHTVATVAVADIKRSNREPTLLRGCNETRAFFGVEARA